MTAVPGLVPISQTTLNVRLEELLLSGTLAADHVLGASLEELVKKCPTLQARLTRMMDARWICSFVGAEAGTLVLKGLAASIWEDVARSLNPLQCETTVNVPHDMAVHQPHPWIVRLEANNSVARRVAWTSGTDEHSGITTGRVDEVQGGNQIRCPVDGALAQQAQVMSVQMHGVGCEELILNDEVDPFVRRAQGNGIGDQGAIAALSDGF